MKDLERTPLKAGVDYTGVSIGFFCHDGAGKFLLHKRSANCRDEHGAWDWGGGKLEFGEGIEEAILREVKEEYGCDGELGERYAIYTRNRINPEGKPTHWVVVGHFVRVNPARARLNEPESMDEIGWFAPEDFPTPLHSSWELLKDEMQEKFRTLTNV